MRCSSASWLGSLSWYSGRRKLQNPTSWCVSHCVHACTQYVIRDALTPKAPGETSQHVPACTPNPEPYTLYPLKHAASLQVTLAGLWLVPAVVSIKFYFWRFCLVLDAPGSIAPCPQAS